MIVPDTEVGERVTIRLDDVQENVGFAEVVKRQHNPVLARVTDVNSDHVVSPYRLRRIG